MITIRLVKHPISLCSGNELVFFYSGVLIGNKTDKENYRAVSTQEGKQLATSRKMGFFECSAVSEIVWSTEKSIHLLLHFRRITKE